MVQIMNARITGEGLPTSQAGRTISGIWKEAAKCFLTGQVEEARQHLLVAKRHCELHGIPCEAEAQMIAVLAAI